MGYTCIMARTLVETELDNLKIYTLLCVIIYSRHKNQCIKYDTCTYIFNINSLSYNVLFHTNGIIIPYCNVGKSIERELFEASSFDLFLK